MEQRARLFAFRRLAILILGGATAWWVLSPPGPAAIEAHYARGIYPAIASGLVPLADVAPFSLSVTAIVFTVICVPAGLAHSWRAGRRQGRPLRHTLARWVGAAAFWGLAGHALFIVLWGAGYRRERLEQRLGLGTEAVEAADVQRWVEVLARRLGETLIETLERDPERARASLVESLRGVLEEWDGVEHALPRRIKLLPTGSLLAFGTAGVTSPFFLEAHVDAGEPEVAALWTFAHELAHVGGLCAEADADLAAAVAGLRAGNDYARYAVLLRLFDDFARALPRQEAEAARASLPAEAQADLRSIREAQSRFRIEPLARAQHAVYDRYLRSQGVAQGVKEYGFLVRSLVRAERRGVVRLEEAR